MTKLSTMLDLQKALEGIGMSPSEVKEAVAVVAKAIGTKYMTELYASVPEEVIEQVQTMSKDGATEVVHKAYFEKTGQQATDRLDEIIDQMVSDMVERPSEYFQKKS